MTVNKPREPRRELQGERNKQPVLPDIEFARCFSFSLIFKPSPVFVIRQATVFDPTVALACA